MRTFLILTWDNLKGSLQTKKALIFLALYLLIFALISYGFFTLQAEIEEQILAQGVSGIQRDFMIDFATNVIQNQTENNFLMQFLFDIPPINIMLFFVSLIGTPILLFIINYDKISQEIYDGTIRYLLFRASRFKIFFAKFLSSFLECSLITLFAVFIGVLWGSLRFDSVDFSESMSYGLRFWMISQFFLSVFVALSLLASSIFKKPFTSLIVCFLIFIAMPILAYFFPYISPFETEYFKGLFFHNSYQLFFSLAVYTLYTAIFLSIGYSIFKRKDL